MTGSDLILLLIVALACMILGWVLHTLLGKFALNSAKSEAKKILEQAEIESENLKKEKELEASEEYYTLKQNLESDYRKKKQFFQDEELRLSEKDSNIDRKADFIAKRESELDVFEKDLKTFEQQNQQKQEKLNRLINEHNQMLEKTAGLTADEAKKILMDNLVEEAKRGAAKDIQMLLDETKKDGQLKAQNIMISAIQQCGINVAIESTVTTVTLASDDMKGRIIGREGRNIRAFEVVTGVDVIVDDTPGSVILSGFDPMRREIARIVMERLVADGRIHPGRIEDMYAKVKTEMDDHLKELGEQALLDCGIHGVHNELTYLLGKLRFRVAYGQNVLQHSKEVAQLAGIMASELGLDVNLAKRAGILHDIGRAVERTTDGNHAQIGYDIVSKYGENPIVLNAIAAHHNDVEPTSPISVLVQMANNISATRPGARREAVENFITRLKHMEAIAESFEAVQSSYAVQAGKEVRVIVSHEKVDDAMLPQLANDIVQKIETEIEYPGQIKVVLIREFRGVDYA
jgi:ribonuclease Y